MALTDVAIKKAKPQEKPYKLPDGNGLWLYINPNGAKFFRYRYEYLGKENLLSFGKYPEISLVEAREKRVEARKLLQQNINPSLERKKEKRFAEFKGRNTFKVIAEEWHDTNKIKWTPEHAKKLLRRLDMHIFPTLGARPIAEITTIDLLDVIRKIEKDSKTETTHKLVQSCRSIFQYAVLTQKIKYNPAIDLRGVLKPHKTKNYPTISHNQIPEFLLKLEGIKTHAASKLAVKMIILTFVRQGELRRAKWVDIDFKAKEWRIPPETTKMRQLHIVPLSKQVIEVLHELKTITGESEYLFPSQHHRRHPIMSENTINNIIHKMGYKGELVGHGFRAMASTILNEEGFRVDVIERQLAHMPRDKVRAAYNRADYLPERRKMMQWWADYISHKVVGKDG